MRQSRFAVAFATLCPCALALAAPPEPAPGAPPAAAAAEAPVYKNPGLGVTLKAPPGWTVSADREAGEGWQRLCVVADKASGAETTVSMRKARSGSLGAIRDATRKLLAADGKVSVTTTTDVAPTPARPYPGVLFEGTQTIPAPPPPKTTGAPPPPAPPMVMRFRWLQILAQGREWLVHTTVRATVWSRAADAILAVEQGFSLEGEAAKARGDGAFRDEEAGFSCRYPAGYGVRVPDRKQQVVEFAPAGEGPVLGVFRYESSDDLETEADALVAYYTGEEIGGEAEKKSVELSGRSAYVVRAKGRVENRDEVFFVAVLKRDSDTTFRLRVAADVASETAAQEAFDAFLKSFALLNG